MILECADWRFQVDIDATRSRTKKMRQTTANARIAGTIMTQWIWHTPICVGFLTSSV